LATTITSSTATQIARIAEILCLFSQFKREDANIPILLKAVSSLRSN
jgi:hypothetical protein